MDDETFWSIIASFNWRKTGDDDKVLRPALRKLKSLPISEIVSFENILAAKLYQLDTREHARWCYRGAADPDNGDDYIAADDFLYQRCVVVANGRDFYDSVLADPSQFPVGLEFESLIYLARDAYEQRTGAEPDAEHDYSWETFSNAEGWRPTAQTKAGRFTGTNVPPLTRRPS